MLHVWNIYQHVPQKSPSFVGKYTSTMEHMGFAKDAPGCKQCLARSLVQRQTSSDSGAIR
jgi:hypothetical protein